jgi:hypothetical protein
MAASNKLELAMRIKVDAANAKSDIESLTANVKGFGSAAQDVSAQTASASRALSHFSDSAGKAVSGNTKLSQNVRGLCSDVNLLKVAFIGLQAVGGFGGMIKMADDYGQMAVRIKMVTASTAEYEMVQRRLMETADQTYRPLAEAQDV